MTLKTQIERVLKNGTGPSTIHEVIDICISQGDMEALVQLKNLSDDGSTYEFELKIMLSHAFLFWGKEGIDCLVQVAIDTPRVKNVTRVLTVLPLLATKDYSLKDELYLSTTIKKSITGKLDQIEDVPSYSRSKLIEFLLSFKDESDISIHLGTAITQLGIGGRDHAIKELIAAMGAIQFAVGEKKIKEYDLLISSGSDEPKFQTFFEENPQFLDPNVIQIWPKPNLGGKYIPDFIIRRSDDSYVVVEIETPSKGIITKSGQLFAVATQAEQQVIDYRTYLMERIRDARKHFPNFHEPEGLVVIGQEKLLSEKQLNSLQAINRTRYKIEIVGFDKLKEKSKTITENVIRNGIEAKKIRLS